MGESRLAAMEAELPEEAFVLGVDEHTGVLLDLSAGTATVVGNGTLTIRRRGRVVVHATGTVLELERLGELGPAATRSAGSSGTGTPLAGAEATAATGDPAVLGTSSRTGGLGGALGSAGVGGLAAEHTSLRAIADAIDAAFSESRANRDVDGCVAAILELEQTLIDWSADTLTSDEGQHARGLLRGMVVRLGALAEAGARDPRDVLGPFVSALLELREAARQSRDWATSDRIRDRLAAAGVDVRDTPTGATWEIR